MAMEITQQLLDNADLVLVVGRDGLTQWSASGDRSRTAIANMLRDCADAIEAESL